MPGYTVDGNDILAVYEAAREAVDRARGGGGPTLLECKTYRWRGHHEGDPNQGAKYRNKEEIEGWKKNCPILAFERVLIAAGFSSGDLEQIQERVHNEIEEAVNYSLSCSTPTLENVLEDVYEDQEAMTI
jgi:pyruvate dehydrogenase E1 component alpha subunit